MVGAVWSETRRLFYMESCDWMGRAYMFMCRERGGTYPPPQLSAEFGAPPLVSSTIRITACPKYNFTPTYRAHLYLWVTKWVIAP